MTKIYRVKLSELKKVIREQVRSRNKYDPEFDPKTDIDEPEIHYAECSCGSGEPKEPLYDARGIFVTYVCDKCRKEKMSQYRPEIFDDSDYEHDEPIEPEDY